MTADVTMLVLTAVVGLLAVASVVLVSMQVARGSNPARAEAERQDVELERAHAEIEQLRRKELAVTIGAVRLYHLLSKYETPPWSPVNGGLATPTNPLRQYALLLVALKTLFTIGELEGLADGIGIAIEDVGGETRGEIALRLLDAAKRAGLAELLLSAVKADRPEAKL